MAKGAVEKCRCFLPCKQSGRQELKKEGDGTFEERKHHLWGLQEEEIDTWKL